MPQIDDNSPPGIGLANSAARTLLEYFVPLFLVGLNVWVFGTFAVLSENDGESLLSYRSILWGYYLPGLTVFLVVGSLGLLLRQKWRRALVLFWLWFGLLTYIYGNLLLWDTGVLDGTPLDFSKAWRDVVDSLVLAGVTVLVFLFRRWFATNGWKVALTLIIFQSVGMLASAPESPKQKAAPNFAFSSALETFSVDQNVLHIVLDAFQASTFEILLEAHPEYSHDLSGFTFFRDTTTSTEVTYLSIPATLSGKPFRNQTGIDEYMDVAIRGKNLYSFMAANGYAVDVVSPLWWNQPNPVFSSYYRLPTPYAGEQQARLGAALLWVDVSLFRQVPHFLKPLIYNSGTWLFSKALVNEPKLQFQHFSHNAFLSDLRGRISAGSQIPRYKFIHLVTPHAPLVVNEDCSFRGSAEAYTDAAYLRQSRCTLENVMALLRQMKEIGVYDQSMIIVHGDHGAGVAFEMDSAQGRTNSIDALDQMWGNPLPLLLVKPPAAKGSLGISNRQVQLLDIPATVASTLNLQHEFPGLPMFGERDSDLVERFYYRSTMHRNDAAAKNRFDDYIAYKILGSVYDVESWSEGSPVDSMLPVGYGDYEWGTSLSFGAKGSFLPLQNGGWTNPRYGSITWTEGQQTQLAIRFPEISGDVMMRAKVKPYLVAEKLDKRFVKVIVDGSLVGEWVLTESRFQEVEMLLPVDSFESANDKTTISFELPDANSPEAMGTGRDDRLLGLAFLSLQFKPVQRPVR